MTLTALDWAIVAGYFLLSAGIGFLFTKRGGESLDEYFLSGRKVPWWLAGAAMVATTFAADTPLVVAGLVATRGVAGNWLWWNMVMSGMLTVFFFARLWRRANVMTDVEFAEIRYGGRPAAFLRGFRALYLGIAINLIIMGWVTRAMIKILTISLGISPLLAVGICFVVTVAYSVAAGLWAVLWTDLIQFVIKMSAVIVLAIYAVRAVGGMDALIAGVTTHFGSETAALSVLPVRLGANGIEAYAWMPLLALGGLFVAVPGLTAVTRPDPSTVATAGVPEGSPATVTASEPVVAGVVAITVAANTSSDVSDAASAVSTTDSAITSSRLDKERDDYGSVAPSLSDGFAACAITALY